MKLNYGPPGWLNTTSITTKSMLDSPLPSVIVSLSVTSPKSAGEVKVGPTTVESFKVIVLPPVCNHE